MSKPTSALCYRAVEFRAKPTEDGRNLEGYAAVFNEPTRIDSWEGEFDEVIREGAFTKTITERTPVLQFDHGRDARTGTVPIGALQELREDEHGLFVHAELFDNDAVKPIRDAIAGGAIDGMSFRFRVMREEWFDNTGKAVPASDLQSLLYKPGDKGPLRRDIREVQLFELGPVVFPAYESTTVGVRSLLAGLPQEEQEELIRRLAKEKRLAVDLHSPSGAVDSDTPDETPDAAQQGTSGLTPAECEHALRALDLRLGEVA